MSTKTCYLFRGPPGSGKTTAAKALLERLGCEAAYCSADDFHVCPCCGHYNWRLESVTASHLWCQGLAARAMDEGLHVIVDNCNLTAASCRPYVRYADFAGYAVVFVEPSMPWAFDLDELLRRGTHGVPREKLESMLARWEPCLTAEKVLGEKADARAGDGRPRFDDGV